MESLQELEGKIKESINLIIEVAKDKLRLGTEVEGDNCLSDLKAVMLDCIVLEKKAHNFQQAVKHVQKETNETENLEDALTERYEALNADINDNLTEHQSYQNLLEQFEVGSIETEDATSTDIIDEDAENSFVMTQEVGIPLDPITKQPLVDPVVNKICRHFYERDVVMRHIAERRRNARCPVNGCANSAVLQVDSLREDAKMKKLIQGKKRGDASFFSS